MEARTLESIAAPCRPFLKWVGGKRQLVPELVARAPASFGRYFEPFVGGGALFFHLLPREALLADANERLIGTYRAVRDDVDGVIDLLRAYPYDSEFYCRLRERAVDARSDTEVAAWFIYLSRAGFNGPYRVNLGNQFNVEGRVTFRARWPKYQDGRGNTPRDYLSITCNAHREPRALAR